MTVRAEYKKFVEDAEQFMDEFNLGPGQFGRLVCSNGRLMERLYSGGRFWPETIERASATLKSERKRRRAKSKAVKARASSKVSS